MLGTWGRWGHTGKQAVQQALWEPSASRRNHLWDIQAWLGHLWKTGQGDDSWDTHGTGRMVRLVGTRHHGHGDDDGKRAMGNLQRHPFLGAAKHIWSTSGLELLQQGQEPSAGVPGGEFGFFHRSRPCSFSLQIWTWPGRQSRAGSGWAKRGHTAAACTRECQCMGNLCICGSP